jgi:hypothetical protein
MLKLDNITKEQKSKLAEKAEQALALYVDGANHSAGYDVLRYAKAGFYTLNKEVFDAD